MLRRDLERLVAMLAGIDGVGDIALTTNVALPVRKARSTAAAGLRRVMVSPDSLGDAVFMALNDAAFPVAGVLDAIAAAAGAGLPVKVNMVVRPGCNDQSVLPMAEHFRAAGMCCASSSSWMSARPAAGGSMTSLRPPRSWR